MPSRPLATIAALASISLALPLAAGGPTQPSYVNWESPHVHPLDLTPGGSRLLAVNTADDRLEVWAVGAGGGLAHLDSIPVGLDPVSVRARTENEAWVVNRISGSVSIVNLDAGVVVATVPTGDEPADVVFAGDRAFISEVTDDAIRVVTVPYSPAHAPTIVPIDGEDPRGLATDGTTVHVAIFNAGNRTTVLNHSLVTNPDINPYPGDPNPPPNTLDGFDPPINPVLLEDADGDGQPDIRMPRSSMMLKMDGDGAWRDEAGADWSAGPFWTLHGHALAHVDVASLAVTYTSDLMTTNTAIDVRASDGRVAVVGTHALNHIRFEPNLRGRFITVGEALLNADGGNVNVHALNPHLIDVLPDPLAIESTVGIPLPQGLDASLRAQSVGDPRGVAWSPGGGYRLVAGRGTNTLIKVGANGARLATIDVGQGPTGVRFHPSLPRAYVLNQFDASISVVDTDAFAEGGVATFFDPTPVAIKSGRPHFYGTQNSLLGQSSCQSCHLDGGMDLLGWDLGDPSGDMKEFNQVCQGGGPTCDEEDWHPMKGPMATQTLIGLEGTAPFHWRGDREDLAAFNPAFDTLLGGSILTDEEVAEFEAFVLSMRFPPNPFRGIDGALPTAHPNGGDAQNGAFLFVTPPPPPPPAPLTEVGAADQIGLLQQGHLMEIGSDGPTPPGPTSGFGCAGCHALPTGSDSKVLRPLISDGPAGIHHLTKTAQLRNLYRKDGFDAFAGVPQSRGTGFLHDGSLDSLQTFLQIFFAMTAQERLDVEAYLLSFSSDTHAGVGTQVTITGADDAPPVALRDQLLAIADTGTVGLVAKGLVNGERRGYAYLGSGTFQSDRAAEVVSVATLDAGVTPDAPVTYTLVPAGTETRLGLDRDEDGVFDHDEIDVCFDPADPDDVPGEGYCHSDIAGDGDGVVGFSDLNVLLAAWGMFSDVADLDCNGSVGFADLSILLGDWGPCP